MKLYTEEQVRVMLSKARWHNMDDTEMFTDDYIVEQQTPIELPSDEEMLKAAKECVYEDLDISVGSFELGARWYREQLKNQQQ